MIPTPDNTPSGELAEAQQQRIGYSAAQSIKSGVSKAAKLTVDEARQLASHFGISLDSSNESTTTSKTSLDVDTAKQLAEHYGIPLDGSKVPQDTYNKLSQGPITNRIVTPDDLAKSYTPQNQGIPAFDELAANTKSQEVPEDKMLESQLTHGGIFGMLDAATQSAGVGALKTMLKIGHGMDQAGKSALGLDTPYSNKELQDATTNKMMNHLSDTYASSQKTVERASVFGEFLPYMAPGLSAGGSGALMGIAESDKGDSAGSVIGKTALGYALGKATGAIADKVSEKVAPYAEKGWQSLVNSDAGKWLAKKAGLSNTLQATSKEATVDDLLKMVSSNSTDLPKINSDVITASKDILADKRMELKYIVDPLYKKADNQVLSKEALAELPQFSQDSAASDAVNRVMQKLEATDNMSALAVKYRQLPENSVGRYHIVQQQIGDNIKSSGIPGQATTQDKFLTGLRNQITNVLKDSSQEYSTASAAYEEGINGMKSFLKTDLGKASKLQPGDMQSVRDKLFSENLLNNNPQTFKDQQLAIYNYNQDLYNSMVKSRFEVGLSKQPAGTNGFDAFYNTFLKSDSARNLTNEMLNVPALADVQQKAKWLGMMHDALAKDTNTSQAVLSSIAEKVPALKPLLEMKDQEFSEASGKFLFDKTNNEAFQSILGSNTSKEEKIIETLKLIQQSYKAKVAGTTTNKALNIGAKAATKTLTSVLLNRGQD